MSKQICPANPVMSFRVCCAFLRSWILRVLLPAVCALDYVCAVENLQHVKVDGAEQMLMIRHVIPLPREIKIHDKVQVSREQIKILRPTHASPIVARAAEELRSVLRLPATPAADKKTAFVFSLEIGGDAAAALGDLENKKQAYQIVPITNSNGLTLAALGPRGLYYACKTLQQLLRAGQTNKNEVEIPICTVLDWPEMEDRGLWGVDSFKKLEWMAERKLNYVEQITSPSVDPQTKKTQAGPKAGHEPLLQLGPQLAIQYVPVILHLEQLEGKGVFEAYPQLRGNNKNRPGAICYSRPEFVGVLAGWMEELVRLPYVEEVDVWMAENMGGKGGCTCESCSRGDRNLLELETIIKAWTMAKQKVGSFGLRILTSEETYPSHKALFQRIPHEVKLWYYHSLLTYNSMERPMITGEVRKYAEQGRWTGVCPNLVAHVGFPEPFSSGQFIHFRISEFVKHKLQGIIGYPSPRVLFARYNVEAMAEWTWNPNGRDAAEFARAWAVREGIADPETFAQWAELHGMVSWDVYGSDWPAGEMRGVPGAVAQLLKKGKLPPLGEVKWGLYASPWGDFKTAGQLMTGVKAAADALVLAKNMGVPEFVQESLVVQGYMNALKALYDLKLLTTAEGINHDRRDEAQRLFETYEKALMQSAKALALWGDIVAESDADRKLVSKPVEKLQQMISEMQQTSKLLLSSP